MLLAVDSSTQFIGLALSDGAEVISEHIWRTHNHHSVELSPAIEQVMRQSNVDMSQLTSLAIALGPGSFTSLRIGLAVVKGIAFSLHLPLVGVPTLDVLAAGIQLEEKNLVAVLQQTRQWRPVVQADGEKWAATGGCGRSTLRRNCCSASINPRSWRVN